MVVIELVVFLSFWIFVAGIVLMLVDMDLAIFTVVTAGLLCLFSGLLLGAIEETGQTVRCMGVMQ